MTLRRRDTIAITVLGTVLSVGVAAAWLQRADLDDHAESRGTPTTGAQQVHRWGPITEVARGSRVGVPAVAFDPVIGTVAVWPDDGSLFYRIRRPHKSSWGPLSTVPIVVHPTLMESALVATDGHGAVTIAWLQMNVPKRRVQLLVTTRSLSGRWSTPTTLWDETWSVNLEMAPIASPRLAVGTDGSATVLWTTYRLKDPQYEESELLTQAHATYRNPNGPWQYRRSFPAPIEAQDVDIDNHGVATVVLTDGRAIRTIHCDHGIWKDAEAIPSHNSGAADIEVAPDGASASLVFGRHLGDRNEVLATHHDGSTWAKPVRISPRPQSSVYYTHTPLALNSGVTTIVLTSWTGPVYVVTRSAGHAYSVPQPIAGPSSEPGADRDVLGTWANDNGDTLAIWGPRGNNGGWKPYASVQSPDHGKWRTPTPLTNGKTTHEEDVFTQSSHDVAAVMYRYGSALTLWSDGHRILMRELFASQT